MLYGVRVDVVIQIIICCGQLEVMVVIVFVGNLCYLRVFIFVIFILVDFCYYI